MQDRIEEALERMGGLLCRRPLWVIGAVVLALAAGSARIGEIEFETSFDAFLPPGDEAKLVYDQFREEFGRDDVILVAIGSNEIFDLDFLAKLREFHRAIEREIPHVSEVDSLINARDTRADGDVLVVGDLFEEWPEDEADLAVLRDRAMANPLYPDLILSRDHALTTVTVELGHTGLDDSEADVLAGFDDAFDSPADAPPRELAAEGLEREAVEALYDLLGRYQAPDFQLWVAGTPVINTDLMTGMIEDVLRFTVLSLVMVSVMLLATFRCAVGLIAPIAVALSAVLGTVGLMAPLGIPAMPVSELIPSFLLCTGVGGTVHLLTIYFQRHEAGVPRAEAIAAALRHSGLPIVMTSLTTAAGVASFAAAGLVPLAVFGTLAPLGVLMTMLLSLTLGPALMAVLPTPRARPQAADPPRSIALLGRCGAFATHHATAVLVGAGLILSLGALGLPRLEFTHNPMDWFPDDKPVKAATKLLDDRLAGAVTLELLIDSGRENGLHEPELLSRIEDVADAALRLQAHDVWVGKTVSLVDIVKEINQALHADRSDAYTIPQDRALVSQELLLFESSGSDDLEDVVDPSFQTARMTLKVPYVDGGKYLGFERAARAEFGRILGDAADLTLTGMLAVMGRSSTATIETMIRAYLLALAIITPLMILLLGKLRLGLLAMIPNLYPIVLTLGLMGWLGVPLEMFSMLIGSIALGLAVDDTVHFMHGFRRAYEKTLDVDLSVKQTLQTTGQALLFTSVVLSIGFFIYVFSSLQNLTDFGILTAFAIIVAFLGDILLAPALMAVTLGRPSRRAP